MQQYRSRVAAFCWVCFTLAFVGCAAYPHSTPEKLGKSLFKALKKQQTEALVVLLPNKEDLEAFLSSADIPEEELAGYRAEMDAIIEEFQKNNLAAFQATTNEGSAEGIVFSKTKFRSVKANTRQGPDNLLAVIDVQFEFDGKPFILHINDAGLVKNGWVLGEGFELGKTLEEFAPEGGK
jgi:hypothetical protein